MFSECALCCETKTKVSVKYRAIETKKQKNIPRDKNEITSDIRCIN